MSFAEDVSRHAAGGHVARKWLPGAERGPKQTARKGGYQFYNLNERNSAKSLKEFEGD